MLHVCLTLLDDSTLDIFNTNTCYYRTPPFISTKTHQLGSAGGGCCDFAITLSGLVVAYQMAKTNQANIDILAAATGVPIIRSAAAGAGDAVLWKLLVAVTTLHFMAGSAAPEPQGGSAAPGKRLS